MKFYELQNWLSIQLDKGRGFKSIFNAFMGNAKKKCEICVKFQPGTQLPVGE
jgi:hypothetical protein